MNYKAEIDEFRSYELAKHLLTNLQGNLILAKKEAIKTDNQELIRIITTEWENSLQDEKQISDIGVRERIIKTYPQKLEKKYGE